MQRAFTLLVALTLAVSIDASEQGLSGFDTDTSKREIDLRELVSGGPPKDGIPALSSPDTTTVKEAREWIDELEGVVLVEVDGQARIYPLQILMWHEIINDRIGERPIAVTFCPLCYSAVVFDREVDGRTLDFGVSGLLRGSDMVMYDRQTESLWQQSVGHAMVGAFTGTDLTVLPAQLLAFEQAAAAHPDAPVISRETGHRRRYGSNPYGGYDKRETGPMARFFRGRLDGRLPPKERVVAVVREGESVVYPFAQTGREHVIHDRIGEQPVVVFHGKGARSALDQRKLAHSKHVGSAVVFDPRVQERELRFSYRKQDNRFVDEQTGSVWHISGEALEGPLQGEQLMVIPHSHHFAFAWLAFRPQTRIYGREE